MPDDLINQWVVASRLIPARDPLLRSYETGMMELERVEMPSGHLRHPIKEIVLEGCLGDAAVNRYWPAIRVHVEQQRARFWGSDLYDPEKLRKFDAATVSDKNEGKKLKRMQQCLEQMRGLRTVYLNKRNREDVRIYENLVVDAVFIATPDETHCEIARKWLGRAKWIFIEKPLDSSVENIEALEEDLNQYGGEVVPLGFDHYRAKALPLRQMIQSFLGWFRSSPEQLIFYLLESETIEEESRAHTLKRGLILDLFPHCLSLLMFFGDPSTFQLDNMKVGRYEGAQIDKETFAAIKFTLKSHDNKPLRGTAYIGKGVKGVKGLRRAGKISEAGPRKLLEVYGPDGRIVRLDFLRDNNTLSIEQGGQEQVVAGLIDPPHNFLVDSLIFNRLSWDHSCFSIKAGKIIVAKITEMMAQIPDDLPSYRTSDYLEDILQKISWPYHFEDF
jgi:predicted dehydrogenase